MWRGQVKKILDRFKASYEDKYPKVQAFLSSTAEMLEQYGVKLRTRLEPKHPFSGEEVSQAKTLARLSCTVIDLRPCECNDAMSTKRMIFQRDLSGGRIVRCRRRKRRRRRRW